MKRSSYLCARRVADVFAASILILASSPIMACIGLIIRLRLGSPVLFRQVRRGHRGEFTLLKFRTMVNDAEALGGGYMPSHLNLVPPLGSFLRKSSLDELPQLLNILRGDMSFVGPRPALPDQVKRYTAEQRGRLAVPQGITGLAQVRYRNEAPWSVRIESDLEYVQNLGFRRDLLILIATVGRVLRGSGIRADQTAQEVDDLHPGSHTNDGEHQNG